MKNGGSTPILTNLVGSTQGTSTLNLKQIPVAVQEKKSTMGYYIVTYSNTLKIYKLRNYPEAH